MSEMATQVAAPTAEAFDSLTKDQLIQLAERYEIPLNSYDKRRKDVLKTLVREELVELSLLPPIKFDGLVASDLTFDQQKELLQLQINKGKQQLAEQQVLAERCKLDQEIQLGKLEIERERLALERQRLSLVETGNMGSSDSGSSPSVDITKNIRLLPKFDESDVDTFFNLFERVADLYGWPDATRCLMLQCTLSGRAAQAYSALGLPESRTYSCVKKAVLRAYELVPEAYRQKFRGMRKPPNQSYVEFADELSLQFKRWCSSTKVESIEDLSNLVLVEQFKTCLPEDVAVYISEHQVATVSEAAVLADDYALVHKSKFAYAQAAHIGRSYRGRQAPQSKHLSDVSPSSYSRSHNSQSKLDPNRRCNYCLGVGHWKFECEELKRKNRNKFKHHAPAADAAHGSALAISISGQPRNVCESNVHPGFAPFLSQGFVSLTADGKKVPINILRDTGSVESFILQSVLPFSSKSDSNQSVYVRGIDMNVLSVPLHRVYMFSDMINGEVLVGVRPAFPLHGVSMILGNGLANSLVWATGSSESGGECAWEPDVLPFCGEDVTCVSPATVVTRAAARATARAAKAAEGDCPGPAPLIGLPTLPRKQLIEEQQTDTSLQPLFDKANNSNNVDVGYIIKDDVLVRKCPSHNGLDGGCQVVVPVSLRKTVLTTAHDCAGHMGVKKTYDRITRHCYWPRIKRDVTTHVKTCHTCQLTGKPNQMLKPVPLRPITPAPKPFEHLVIDCVGPLPRSKSGCVYLLTVICQTTRYPAAYPLRSITVKPVVKALSQFISIFGLPKLIQSDRGTNFTSKMFSQVLHILNIKHNKSSPRHPQSQGVLERFHQTYKSMLRAYCVELGRDWEDGLPWLLLAVREVTQASTGFSPNELVFGHTVRGQVTRLFNDCVTNEPPKSLTDYVNG
ncbi:hypothetical protein ACEWY4_000026 [Coilia grayii]|uniref:Gypsy retrotransposon integrase-like protein 1 n=1 Tax=Coilia grayii TaxID=363190 RepID=A0ABD1KWQ3_9TELE